MVHLSLRCCALDKNYTGLGHSLEVFFRLYSSFGTWNEIFFFNNIIQGFYTANMLLFQNLCLISQSPFLWHFGFFILQCTSGVSYTQTRMLLTCDDVLGAAPFQCPFLPAPVEVQKFLVFLFYSRVHRDTFFDNLYDKTKVETPCFKCHYLQGALKLLKNIGVDSFQRKQLCCKQTKYSTNGSFSP